MFEMLDGYLEATVTPEQRRVCLEACQALVDAGIEEHAALIENELAVVETQNGDALIAVVEGLLIPLYRNLLGEYGVRLIEEATLSQHVDVFKALNQIENYDDSETVYQLCDSPEGSEAALADVLALIGGQSTFDYLQQLAYVSPSLLERIQELHRTEALPASETPQVERARRRLRKLLESPLAQTLPEPLILGYVEEGGRLGVDVRWLIKPDDVKILETRSPAQLALEVVCLAAASNSTDESLPAIVSHLLSDQLNLTLPVITEVDVTVQKLLKVLHA